MRACPMKFAEIYPPDNDVEPGDTGALESWSQFAPGIVEFMRTYSGRSFGNGIYRVHAIPDVFKWTRICESTYPAFKGRNFCFSYDWQGNHFALDPNRMADGKCLLLLFEIGTGVCLEIPAHLDKFHNELLIDDGEAALSYSTYQ